MTGLKSRSNKSENLNKKNNETNIWINKNFLYLFIGKSLYDLTFVVFTISIPIIIYEISLSPFAMSFMRVLEFIPNLLLAIFIGVVVDRLDKKKILQITALIQLICVFLIFLLYTSSFLSNSYNIFYIYVIGFILFVAGYTFGNTYQTVLPTVVNKSQLISANASFSIVSSIISIIGPSFAAMIFFILSQGYSLLITLVGILILLILVSLINIPKLQLDKSVKNKSFKSEIADGWKQLISTKLLWIMTLMILCFNIVNGLTGAVLIFFALDSISLTDSQLGIVLSTSGLGALIASSLAKKSLKYSNRGSLFLLSMTISLIAHIILLYGESIIMFGISLALIGFSSTLINIHYITLRQQSTPNHLLGRVVGTSSMIMKMAVPISFFIGGLLGELIDVRYIFLLSASILLLIIVYGLGKRIHSIN